MAVNDPTPRYGLLLPDVGGDVGAWGGMLRAIFGADDTEPVLGLDAIIGAIEDTANAALPADGGTATGNLEIAPASGESLLTINRGSETVNADVRYENTGSVRAEAGITNSADADYRVRMFDDGGVGTNVLTIDRATHEVSVSDDLTVGGALNVGSFAGDGSGLTNLNASQLSTGTVPDARFPSTMNGPLKYRGETAGSLASVTYGFAGASNIGLNQSGGTLQFITGGTERLRISDGLVWARGGAVFQGNGSLIDNLNASNISTGTAPASAIPNLPASRITSGSFDDARLSGSYTNIVNLTASGLATLEDAQIGSLGTAISRVQVFQFTISGQASIPSGSFFTQTFTASNVTASSKLLATKNVVQGSQGFTITHATPGAGQITIGMQNNGGTSADPDGSTVTVLELVTV